MSRSNLISSQGYQRLQQERDWLWRTERPKITQSVSEAAAMGDRSENAEYIYGKRRLREIDRRLRYLGKRLELLKAIDPKPDDPSKIRFGAWVWLEDEHEQQRVLRIMGTDEHDLHPLYISLDSPMAKALIGKAVEDEVQVMTPRGVQLWYPLAISYGQPKGWPQQALIEQPAQSFLPPDQAQKPTS